MSDGMVLTIQHTTTYRFDEAVPYALQRLRMRPATGPGQNVESWQLSITGGRIEASYEDGFGNLTDLVRLYPDVTEVQISAQGKVHVSDHNGVYGAHQGYAPIWLFEQSSPLTAAGNGTRQLAASLRTETAEMDDVASLHYMATEIGKIVAYEKGTSTVNTTVEQAISAGKGVCQDQAHVMIAVARQLGFPARYVSGYLLMDDVAEQEASHGWCEAFVGGLGWVGFDVANEVCPDSRYVRLATGRDYSDAAPLKGLRHGNGAENLQVLLQVQQ